MLVVALAGLAVLASPGRSSPAARPRIDPSSSAFSAQGASPPASGQGPQLNATQINAMLREDSATLRGSYGVAVIDLASGASYGINTEVAFRAASVNKLPILIALYQRVGMGSLDLNETVSLTDDDIQHYGTGLIQDSDSSRTYSLRNLAALMIETSDNTAAYVLERYLGQESIQAAVQRWNLAHTSMADNTTSAGDAASLLWMLYSRQLLPPALTDVALSLLQHTVFEDRLASGLPPGVAVAHKVGTDVGVYNDAGIVFAGSHPYAVAILTQKVDETEARHAFSRMSSDIYNFQMSLPPTVAP